MALHWIVPARRVVIATDKTSYRAVLEGWLEQLGEHRRVLLSWYEPQAPGVDLARGFERARRRLSEWIERFFAGPAQPVTVAVAPDERNQHDELGFWGRLWGGPLRVLCEEQASAAVAAAEAAEEPPARSSQDDAPPDTTPLVSELDVDGPVVVHLDRRQRIVLNHDAQLLPGDVVELPLYRLLWLAGVRGFEGAHFNGQGSCFLGTAVVDREGRCPGSVWLHDNLLAMRFQLLFNAARGSFSSFRSGFVDAAQTRRARPVDVVGRRVHARGFIYGGALLSPGRPTHHQCHTGNWGSVNVPTGGTLVDFEAGTRLTNGWACNPCALNLLAYMARREDHWRGGSVNGNARNPRTRGQWIRDIVHHDHFHHSFGGLGGTDVLRYQAERLGLPPEQATSEAVREHALRRLFDQPLPPAPLVPDELDPEGEDEPVPEPTAAPGPDRPVDHSRVVRGGSEDEDEPDPHDDDHHLPPPTLDVSAVLPGDQEVRRSHDQMLRYMDGAAFAAIGLQGHEYSWVVAHPHAALTREGRQTIAGTAERPPQVGPLAVYDPLTGAPEVPDDGGPTMFIFEATGSFHPCRLVGDGRFGFTVFKVRPFRWMRVEQVWLFRDVGRSRRRGEIESKLQIGESSSFSMGGRSHVRGKHLLAISRVPEVEIRRRHLDRRTFTPLLVHNTNPRRVDRESREVGYPERAVPFPTLAEADADDRYATLAQARETMQRHRATLRAELARFRGFRARVKHLSETDCAAIDARIPSPSFARQAARMTTELRRERDGQVTSLERRIGVLRRNLSRRYAPDPGESSETQPVEQRRSFSEAIAADQQRRAAAPAGRGRRRPRNGVRREEELRAKVQLLERLRRSAPVDWAAEGKAQVIRAWEQHMEDLLHLLDRGGE